MPESTVLHFSGHFRFHMPEFNNDPKGHAPVYDPSRSAIDVMEICGCDPSKYMEFSLFDAKVNQVTYSDGTTALFEDPVVGMPLTLKGFMVDVSPTAICAQIFTYDFRLGDLFTGRLSEAIQSDLRLSIRPVGFGDESAAAHFDCVLDTGSELPSLPQSRARDEFGAASRFEVHLHLNHYTRLDNNQELANHLTGDVYGYVRPLTAMTDANAGRLRNRRLVAHPDIGAVPAIEKTYLTNEGVGPLTRNTDIDGYYDIHPNDKLLSLRNLDFIPFLDRNYTTPSVNGYSLLWETGSTRIALGSFRGDHDEMQRTGGLLTFKLPEKLSQGGLAIDVIQKDNTAARLMRESEYDLVLESRRGVYVSSGETTEIRARVYKGNQPLAGAPIQLLSQDANRRSPIVAKLLGTQVKSAEDGSVSALVQAVDLTATGGVQDPVMGTSLESVPLDRFCGNYVYLRVANPLRRTVPPVEEIEIAVRVLHKVDATSINAPSFQTHIKPLFSMYLRYFPWLHVRSVGTTFTRFLNVEDIQEFRAAAADIVDRLGRDDFDQRKMPRSRDFPRGGRELIQKWIDKGMQP